MIVKCRRLRWAGHVDGMGRKVFHTESWWEKVLEIVHLEDREVNGIIILNWR